MTTKLFNRKYKLIIGPPGQTGKLWDDLQISFKVEKTGDSATNKAEIEIYNLSESSRNYVSKSDLALILEAGYENNFGRIFAGYTTFTHSTKGASRKDDQIRRGFEQKKKEDTDWISKITADDGMKALKHYITLSLADENLTELGLLNKVIDKLNESVKVARGTIKGVKGNRINHGKAISGTFKSVMDKICKNQGLDWQILNGTLNIKPKNESYSDEIILLNGSSGLIGSPEPTEKGYKFSSLLRHEIEPGTLFKAESTLINGIFIASNVTHTGSLNGTEWNTVIEAMPKE